MMTFLQLATFLETVRLGNFTAAAIKMNATQSTISSRIRELEQNLGVTLFDRSLRHPTLTAKGRELIKYAQKAMMLQEDVLRQIGARDALSGVVRLGVAETVAISWLPKLAQIVHREYPNIELELDIALTAHLRSRLESGAIDIALIPGDSFGPGYVARPVGSVQYCWMAGADFKPPKRLLTVEDFKKFRILSLGEHSYHYDTLQNWFRSHGSSYSPDLCNVGNSLSVLSMLTGAGLGISLLPPQCFQTEINARSLKLLKTTLQPPIMSFAAVYKSRQFIALQELIAELAVKASTFNFAASPSSDGK